jgi:hypothetical protein
MEARIVDASINKIFLNSKKIFIFFFFSFLGISILFFNTDKEKMDYLIFSLISILLFSGMYFTSCSFEIDLIHPFITYYRAFGFLGNLTFNLNTLIEFLYKESSDGRYTNFVLVFPEKKLQITMFNTNFLKTISYLKEKYPNIPIRQVTF